MKVRRLLWGLAGIALSGFGFMDALGRANETRFPQISAALPFHDGFADSALATEILVPTVKPTSTQADKLTIEPTDAQATLARRLSLAGYRREPLNAAAARNLGLLAQAEGDPGSARSAMNVARGITRRDLWTDAWLANDHARANEIPQALRSYDEALRSSARAQTVLLPVLLQNLQNDALVQPVIDLLKQRPPWQIEFWGEAPRHAESLVNLAKIREAIALGGIEVTPTADRTLVAELANHGHFEEAERLMRRLSGRGTETPAGGEILRNASFDQQPGFDPFDWQLFFDNNLSSDIRKVPGVLQVSTFSDGGGRVARQLVSLPGTTYTLSARAKEWDQLDPHSFYFRLDCAEKENGRASQPLWIDRPNFSVTFRKAATGCEYYWLTLFALPQSSRRDNVIVWDDISLRPAMVGNQQQKRA